MRSRVSLPGIAGFLPGIHTRNVPAPESFLYLYQIHRIHTHPPVLQIDLPYEARQLPLGNSLQIPYGAGFLFRISHLHQKLPPRLIIQGQSQLLPRLGKLCLRTVRRPDKYQLHTFPGAAVFRASVSLRTPGIPLLRQPCPLLSPDLL